MVEVDLTGRVDMSSADWQAVIDTNLTGVVYVCKAVMPALAEGGRIVNLASIAGTIGFFGQANFAAAKTGVVGLTKASAARRPKETSRSTRSCQASC